MLKRFVLIISVFYSINTVSIPEKDNFALQYCVSKFREVSQFKRKQIDSLKASLVKNLCEMVLVHLMLRKNGETILPKK